MTPITLGIAWPATTQNPGVIQGLITPDIGIASAAIFWTSLTATWEASAPNVMSPRTGIRSFLNMKGTPTVSAATAGWPRFLIMQGSVHAVIKSATGLTRLSITMVFRIVRNATRPHPVISPDNVQIATINTIGGAARLTIPVLPPVQTVMPALRPQGTSQGHAITAITQTPGREPRLTIPVSMIACPATTHPPTITVDNVPHVITRAIGL